MMTAFFVPIEGEIQEKKRTFADVMADSNFIDYVKSAMIFNHSEKYINIELRLHKAVFHFYSLSNHTLQGTQERESVSGRL